MKRVILLRFGGRDVHLPKLIGAFILFAAVLMFFRATAVMFDSWDVTKDCIDKATTKETVLECQDSIYKITGIHLKPGAGEITTRQLLEIFLGPIANLLFWGAAVILGLLLYRTGSLTIPIEETVADLRDVKKREWPKKRK
ncbi:MAG: hypothetical protein HY394_06455 [Candidatus Diapherotrites archaeon]|nr:hypothetical protein [Candidatus Diapherotrites archaeon]